MSHKQYALNFLESKLQADYAAAKMSLELLLEEGVGVGEHSTKDFTDNLMEALEQLDRAESMLETLEAHYAVILGSGEKKTDD
jgi:hypothetical protein